MKHVLLLILYKHHNILVFLAVLNHHFYWHIISFYILLSIDKTFHGELNATSKGEMLSAMTATQGSAGYVAIEQVVGELSGKKGSFVLQHYGTMSKSDDFLLLEVVPDSGTNELGGISGKMAIKIEEGQHFYEFEYKLK